MRTCKQAPVTGFRRILFTAFCLLLVAGALQAQQNSVDKAKEKAWQLGATANGVQCFYRIAECAGKKLVFLKFNNANAAAVKISWQESFSVREGQTEKVLPAQTEKRMMLPSGETTIGNCDATANRELIAQPVQTTPVYSADVRTFAFKNVTVVR